MKKAILSRLTWSHAVIMAAAVADFGPVRPAHQKLKKQQGPITSLELEPTDDILLELSRRRTTQLLVGFAAETEDLLAHAQEKLHAKGVDLLVANNVTAPGSGFRVRHNRVMFLDRAGQTEELPLLSKRDVADRILDRMLMLQAVPRASEKSSRARTFRKE